MQKRLEQIQLKVSYLLIISITVLFSIYAIHSYFTYQFAINDAKTTTLLRSEAQANNIIQDLDKYINSRTIEIQDLTKIEQIQLSVKESNQQFADLDLKELTTILNEANDSDSKTLFLNSIMKNKISEELQNFISSYDNVYDYDIVKELVMTNQYGVNIATVKGKSDYLQSNEDWWKITQNKQNYVGQILYDKNYNDYVIQLAFPILDESSNYIGTLKITLLSSVLFHDFLNDVDILQEAKKKVILVDKNGKIIYESGTFFPSKPPKEYFPKITSDNGIFETSFPDTTLISYASSIGYREFNGFGWIVIIEQESSVIDGFEVLERNFLISTMIGIISAVILGIILSSLVTKPLGNLSKLTVLLGKGDFDAKIQTSKITEINTILNSFRKMETSLKKLVKVEKNLAEVNVRIKNERLTAIGELAASMAHDMKNPLGTIRTGTDILKRSIESNSEIDNVIQRMDRATSRMSHQVEDVLNYVKKTPLSVKSIQIKSIIKSAIESLDIQKTIQITVQGDDITINCDEKKMEIVFINLLLNSIQSIDQSQGIISIRIKQVNKNAVIEIEDNGLGIPEEVANDIFKPLVTTKQKGTGLGLASCKNIIEQHNGSISFQNNPTIFTVIIPVEQNAK
ncbi:MAG: sensor histidine kinase [Nitrosarchaeum sp.]